jgi:hypothetical protein
MFNQNIMDSFIWSGFPVLNILHCTCLTGLKPTP